MRRRLFLLSAPVLSLFSAALADAQGLPPVPVPPGNPITVDKARLGKALFWDEQLSSTRTVSCGTCHVPTVGGIDPRSLDAAAGHPGFDGLFGGEDDVRGTLGVVANDAAGEYVAQEPFRLRPQVTGRSSPSTINAAFAPTLFWDGRADSTFLDPVTGAPVLAANAALESQAVGPPLSDVEMGHLGRSWPDVVSRIAASAPLALATDVPDDLEQWIAGRPYPALFADAFGTPGISPARIAMAIATYERTLISDQSPFDDFLSGNSSAMTSLQKTGMLLFQSQVTNCTACHAIPQFTNNAFRNIGVRPNAEDEGQFAVTGNPNHHGRFKVPNLRNVALRAPYFHNGGMETLADVVDFYDRGGDFHENQAPQIQELGLSAGQKAALVAFLEALTDPRVVAGLPPFDRPTLYAEHDDVPASYGSPAAGTGGVAPRLLALEPPLVGNPSFTFALADALGGATAWLAIDSQASATGDSLPLPIHLGLTPAFRLIPLGSLAGSGAGGGWLSLQSPIPTDASLDGLSVYLQAFVQDPGAALGVAATPGVEVRFFVPEN